MFSKEVARTVVGIIGNVIALILFLSPVPTFYRIWKKRSVEQYSPVPYLATFINCGLWVLYGLPLVHPHSTLVVTINGTGFVIEILYLSLFLIFSDSKKRLRLVVIVVAECIFVAALALLVLTLVHTTKLRSAIIGSICMVGNIMMYASPLAVMAPNGMGTVLGLAQLILYATFYKSTKRIMAERKGQSEVDLAQKDLNKNAHIDGVV
ncbi:Bidirectional sugar transporter SWEET7 [Sesamum angolense]|uniref:Bidirectional sugar transporter SWEET7 n=1 Tax=Sesamum angolense TaxID=2727404 RepID=A0AAE1WVE1_9LAMI|nr:Bidirectional sugar transporter SWEET7 [Sesamum angolense]